MFRAENGFGLTLVPDLGNTSVGKWRSKMILTCGRSYRAAAIVVRRDGDRGMSERVLELAEVRFDYGGLPVLNGVSLDVAAGEFVSLIGPSGSGKSTILRLFAGTEQPAAGRVRVQGAPPRPGGVGYMPQKDCLMPWRTVLDNAALALEVQGVPRAAARARAAGHLADFGLAEFARAYPHELSGGMRQRAAFARTVLGGHDTLLLDEPFGALDALTRAEMQVWLLDLWQRLKKAVLFITHDVEEAVLLSDRVYVLTGRPVTRAAELPIDLPRPRRYGTVLSPRFLGYRQELLALLAPAMPAAAGGGDR